MASLSPGYKEGEPSHFIILIVRHLLLAQPDNEPSCLFVCCPQDVACPWRGCFSFSLLFQYRYFQCSQKEGAVGLEGSERLRNKIGESSIQCPSSFHDSYSDGALSLTSSRNKWCQREKRKRHWESPPREQQLTLITLNNVIALHEVTEALSRYGKCCAEWIYKIYIYIYIMILIIYCAFSLLFIIWLHYNI